MSPAVNCLFYRRVIITTCSNCIYFPSERIDNIAEYGSSAACTILNCCVVVSCYVIGKSNLNGIACTFPTERFTSNTNAVSINSSCKGKFIGCSEVVENNACRTAAEIECIAFICTAAECNAACSAKNAEYIITYAAVYTKSRTAADTEYVCVSTA